MDVYLSLLNVSTGEVLKEEACLETLSENYCPNSTILCSIIKSLTSAFWVRVVKVKEGFAGFFNQALTFAHQINSPNPFVGAQGFILI